MWRQEFIVIAIALVTLVVGIALEIYLGSCSNAISRSGAVIVCISIFFGISDFSATNMLNRDKELSVLKARLEGLNEHEVENDIVFSDADLEAKIRGSTAYLKDRAIKIYNHKNTGAAKVDVAVGILGTLIWSFGDLVLSYIAVCA